MNLIESAAATHRLTRLITKDTITEPLRDRWVKFVYFLDGKQEPQPSPYKSLTEVAMDDLDHPKLIELASCRHCVGIWMALTVLILRRWKPTRWIVSLLAIAGLQSAWLEWTEK